MEHCLLAWGWSPVLDHSCLVVPVASLVFNSSWGWNGTVPSSLPLRHLEAEPWPCAPFSPAMKGRAVRHCRHPQVCSLHWWVGRQCLSSENISSGTCVTPGSQAQVPAACGRTCGLSYPPLVSADHTSGPSPSLTDASNTVTIQGFEAVCSLWKDCNPSTFIFPENKSLLIVVLRKLGI